VSLPDPDTVTDELLTGRTREVLRRLELDVTQRLDGLLHGDHRGLVPGHGTELVLTNRDGNRIGAMLAGRGKPTILPAKGSRKHLLRILHEIASAPRGDGAGVTDLGAALSQLGSVAKRRGLVVVVSDFRVADGWETPLRILTNKHDVLAVEVIDPLELALPNVGPLPISDRLAALAGGR